MVDTNRNRDPIDYIIPSNDDAIRAIRLMATKMADAATEGKAIQAAEEAEVEEAEVAGDEDMSRYLGPSTLAKIQAATETDEVAAEAPVAEATEETAEEA